MNFLKNKFTVRFLTVFCGSFFIVFALAGALVSASTFLVVENKPGTGLTPFTDLDGHWAEAFVADLKAKGVVSGKTATTFGPDDKLTRAELTKIAMNAFGIKSKAGASFSDVKNSDWFAGFVAGAKAEGVVGGYEDGSFKPNAPVTRAEALKILLTAAKVDMKDVAVPSFTDVLAGDWYTAYVGYAVTAKIAGGYPNGSFGVSKYITRGEIAKITSLLLKK